MSFNAMLHGTIFNDNFYKTIFIYLKTIANTAIGLARLLAIYSSIDIEKRK